MTRIARRALSRAGDLRITAIDSGVSTWVYRLRRGDEVFYLRIWPDPGQSFAPEALAHRLVRERGVRAPEVIYSIRAGSTPIPTNCSLPYVMHLKLMRIGYARETPLPADHMEPIRLWSLLIAVRRLGRRVIRRPEEASKDPDLAAIRSILVALSNG